VGVVLRYEEGTWLSGVIRGEGPAA
jgi:hypothetical protein